MRFSQQPFLSLTAFLLAPGLLIGAGLTPKEEAKVASPDNTSFDKQIRPLLNQYCTACHTGKSASAGVDLTAYADTAAVQKDQGTWRKVLSQVRERHMPPANSPQPSADQRETLAMWVGHTLNSSEESVLPKNPGRILIHRLSRTEYNNTVRDLFGVDTKPADSFPADGGGGGGFDNNADTLFIPPILMERLLSAAGEILDTARPSRIFVVRPGKGLPPRVAASKIISIHASRAFRRPVSQEEMARLMRLYDRASGQGKSFEKGVRYALKAVLVSPNFLFRVERDKLGTEAYAISDYELASRLSYFLWASMPDEELFRLASQGKLRKPGVLEAQVRRMTLDPRSRALADSFAGQWLRVRDLYSSAKPDPNRFPQFSPSLRDAMYEETITFFHSLLQEDTSLLRLLDTDYTFVNEELAKHYGIPGIEGKEMRKVHLADSRRGGVLTMGSILTLTSYPLRTSPVLRGKWVLSEVLGSPPPPPPPVVATLSQEDAPKEGLTFRQRLEKHRTKPECAGCHSRMDPLGFGLENYDAVGRWRSEIGGTAVDASGVLTTGEKFAGPSQLKKLLLTRKEEFIRNLTERMLSYALGRGLEPTDMPAVRKITTTVLKDECRSLTLLREIAKSYPFQYRKNQ